MKYATSILLSCTLFIGEVHTFWEKSTPKVENWIIARSVPMTVQWNVKFATDQLNYIIYFLALVLYVKNKVNRTTALAFLMISVLDTFMYFYNYKTYGFGIVYLCFVFFWVWMWYGKGVANWIYDGYHKWRNNSKNLNR